MLAAVESFVLDGIDAVRCEIEVHLDPRGEGRTTIVGLPDAAVRESIERVRTAMLGSGYRFPRARITVNLAPANVRKEGPVYDLPMAVAILLADGTIPVNGAGSGPRRLSDTLLAGELALDGRVRPVRGAIGLALLARALGRERIIVPRANVAEAAAVDGIDAFGVATLGDVVALLRGERALAPEPAPPDDHAVVEAAVDFREIRGQAAAKRAAVIAAAGGHNLLMLGPAGTGKTMLARALPGIMPPMSRAEALDVTRIHSVAGHLSPGASLIRARPVRSPHHTASPAALVGGGSVPRPGEVSLAHHGILFLDELPEFRRDALETLRQPLEDGVVSIARAQGSATFPARMTLIAALNPTPRGGLAKDGSSQRAMERYLERLSGPLIDRIDLHVEVPAVPFAELSGEPNGARTEELAAIVAGARERQRARQGACLNGSLRGARLDESVPLDEAGRGLLERALRELGLSARAYDKIRRVARTLADLHDEDEVAAVHVAEAIQYRVLDRLLRRD